jgi:RNA-directed DNA polymerase
MTRTEDQRWAQALAFALLDGDWTESGLVRRADLVLGHRREPVLKLVRKVLAAYPRPPWDRPRELAAWLLATKGLKKALGAYELRSPGRWMAFQPAMGDMPWPVPAIPTSGELAHLLDISTAELAWFADVNSLEQRAAEERLRHYRYRWVAKAAGGVRVVEAPKTRLREMQRLLLRVLLDRIPVHPAAFGFVAGRSAAGFARVHSGAEVVIRLDLEDFFGTVSAGRVYGVFRTAGYPEAVAATLTGLTTNAVPPAVWREVPKPADGAGLRRHFLAGRRLAQPHLPQGVPSSPALANLCAHRLDRRLSGLAAKFGLVYSRYADDLAVSGSMGSAAVERVIGFARTIVVDEGFSLNDAKVAVMTKAQRQVLAGMVVNRLPNLERREYDRLRAILHNVAREGLESQNRAGHPRFAEHLEGRVSWAAHFNPGRGAALDRLLAGAELKSRR